MKKQLSILVIIAFSCIYGLTGCSIMTTKLYGIKKVKAIDENTILHYSRKYDIPLADNYELDTSYINFLSSLNTTHYKSQIKNHYQPLQALYYNKLGELQSFQINCNAGGFPNLDWDRDSIFDYFPPKRQAPLDRILPLKTQLKYLKPLSKTEKFSPDSFDYVVVVYWSRFMGRQSKRLINFVQTNEKLSRHKKVKIIYVNNDNFFIQNEKYSSRYLN